MFGFKGQTIILIDESFHETRRYNAIFCNGYPEIKLCPSVWIYLANRLECILGLYNNTISFGKLLYLYKTLVSYNSNTCIFG